MLPRLPLAALALLWLSPGCAAPEDVELLEIEAVEPGVLERDETLRVTGSGFVAGRDCRVELDGVLHRAGRPSRPVSIVLEGRAASAEEVEAALDERSFDALGPHGSFEGTLRVAFDAEVGNARVSGASAVHFDLLDGRARRLATQRHLDRKAERLLSRIGLELEPGQNAFNGLVVGWAREDGPAARAGLRRGDVIVRASSVGVHSLGDLTPPPSARHLRLGVLRAPSSAELELDLPLFGITDPVDRRRLERSVLLGLCLLCFLLLSPWPGLPHWLARCRSRLAFTSASTVGLWGTAPRTEPTPGSLTARLERGARRVLWPVSFSLLGVLSVLVSPAVELHSLSAYLSFAAMGLAATAMWGPGPRRERLRRTVTLAGRMAVLAAVLLCACALSGTRSLPGLVAAQGFVPWRWALATEPALLVALPLYVVYAGRAQLPLDPSLPLVDSLSVLGRVLTCGLGAVVFLGGFHPPDYVPGELVPPVVAGAVAFVAKVWVLAHLVALSDRLGLGEARPIRTAGLGLSAVVALTLVELAWPQSEALRATLGPVVVAVGSCALLVSLIWVARSPHPMGHGPLHPRVNA